MASVDDFQSAVDRVQRLPKRPGNDVLLELYGLYKQATAGDVSGKRPGILDVCAGAPSGTRGRAGRV